MTMKFELHGSAAIDKQYGVEIYVPRIVPGDVPHEFGYEYKIVIKGRSDGLGFSATSSIKRAGNFSDNQTSISLSPDAVLQWFFDVKREIACTDDDYAFIVEFARGLLLVFEAQSALYTSYQYVVLAAENALIILGVPVPIDAKRNLEGNIVLAELYVPCRGDADAEA